MASTTTGKRHDGQRALVVGVGDYPTTIKKLPAVAADVREMAKILRSRDGAFPASGVTVLTDKQATRQAVMTALGTAFGQSKADETLFTDALLRGLKGGAASGGEVTANSLFDFIDRLIGSGRQRPMFFGHLTGRVVPMHFRDRGGDAGSPPPGRPKHLFPRLLPRRRASVSIACIEPVIVIGCPRAVA